MSDITPAVMSVSDAARFLAVSESTIRKLIKEKKLPASRVSGAIRVRREAVEALLPPTLA